MQFWKKLVLFIIATISVILAFSRLYIVKSNFSHSIENASKQRSHQFALEKYILQSNLVETIRRGEEVTEERIMESIQSLYTYVDANSEPIAFYIPDSKKVISNMEWIDQIHLEEMLKDGYYWIREIQQKHYLFFSSYWSINGKGIYIINAYDIQDIYEERDRQNREIFLADLIIISISAIVICIFSAYLIQPIKILNQTTKQIASGKYDQRAQIHSKDEIEELASSFNKMADEIENKMKQKDDFVTGFTHELKTPMTAIVGYADLLRLRKCDEEVAKKAIQTIYQESKRLEKLSFKLMELMSLSEDKIRFEKISAKDFEKDIQKIEKNQNVSACLVWDMEEGSFWGERQLLRSGVS